MQYKIILLHICLDEGINMVGFGELWVESEYPKSFVLFQIGWLFGNFQLKIFNKAVCGDYPELVER